VDAHASDLRSRPDGQLLRRIEQHDAGAFEVFYDRHITAAYALALEVAGAAQRAEEACREAFLEIWRASERRDPQAASAAYWVLGIVRDHAIDLTRKATHSAGREGSRTATRSVFVPPRPEPSAPSRARTSARGLLDRLPDDERRVIVLAFYRGNSYQEIATRLQLPAAIVTSRARRGLQRLRRHLVDPPEPPP